jgi:hypothetical protein
VAEGGVGGVEVGLFPAAGEEAGVSNHREVLVGDVVDEARDEGHHLHGLEAGLAAVGVVLEGDGDVLTVEASDTVLGKDGAFRIASDIADAEARVEKRGSDVGVPGEGPQAFDPAGEFRVGAEVGRGAREAELAELVSCSEAGDDLVLPPFLQSAVMHQEPWIGGDPSGAIKAQAARSDDQVDVRMPFQIGAEGMDDSDDAHPHSFDVTSPLLDGFDGGAHEEVEADSSVHSEELTKLPRRGQDEVVIGDVEKLAEYTVGPDIGGVFAAGWAEATLA